MVRIAKRSDPRKLEELKKKIQDEVYIQNAIQRIAQTLTNQLVREEKE